MAASVHAGSSLSNYAQRQTRKRGERRRTLLKRMKRFAVDRNACGGLTQKNASGEDTNCYNKATNRDAERPVHVHTRNQNGAFPFTVAVM